ncbi:hypothetical protein WEI85_40185 [Actinomycetes bacterium KLBMP 9797]
MLRGQIVAAGAAALLTLWGTPAAAAPPVGEPCTFVELRTVEGGDNVMLAADRSGRYQVGAQGHWESPGVIRSRVILWRDGTPRLGPETDPYGGFAAVSSTGIAVGWAHEGGQRRAVAYAYGQIVELAMPADATEATAAAVNARGEVAGTAYGDGGAQRAVAWSPDGEVRVLATPPGFTHASATHIDGDGTVLGYAASGASMPDRARLVVWAPGGAPRVLPVAGSADPEPQMWPIDLRDGVAYGAQDSAFVRWDLDAGTATIVDNGGGSIMAVNARGSMVSFGGFGQDRTVFVGNGAVRPLDQAGLWITPLALSDNDLVFGRSNANAGPAYMDCR